MTARRPARVDLAAREVRYGKTTKRTLQAWQFVMWHDDSDEAVIRAVAALRYGRDPPSPAWNDVLRRDVCAYCGYKPTLDEHGNPVGPPLTIDHIIPVSALRPHKGRLPSNVRKRIQCANAAPACEKCNQWKRSLSLLAFVAAGGLTDVRYRIQNRYDGRAKPGVFRAGSQVIGLRPDGMILATWRPPGGRWFPPRPEP
ncbi:MAG: hypothetical protein E6R03_14085 [Hyphomicrobiaceae bacterium]|nr:MAG: hypothetical protein E6R03_14085 [Hyphomicrobiaceae bacterium]